MIETRPNELIHYGVPGMKWGVRKQQSYLKKSGNAARKAKEYDALGKVAKAGGDTAGATKYANKARKSKMLADRYKNLSKKFDPNTPVGQLEQYKHNRRVQTVVGTAITTVAMAPAVYLGWGVVRTIAEL